MHLENELGPLRAQREHLTRERLEFQQNLAIIKCRLSDLYTQVFSQLRDEEGHPYSVDEYLLQQLTMATFIWCHGIQHWRVNERMFVLRSVSDP